MNHIKFLSISSSWQIATFMEEVGKAMKFANNDFNQIKMIHVERLENQRRHIRVSFFDNRMIRKVIRGGKETSDTNVYSIKLKNSSILFEVIDSKKEKFKIQNHDQETRKNILSVTLKNENIKEVASMLNNKFSINFLYISINNNRAFIKVDSKVTLTTLIAKLNQDKYKWKYAQTFILLEKYRNNNNNRISPERIVRFDNNSAKVIKTVVHGKNAAISNDIVRKIDEISKKVDNVMANSDSRAHNFFSYQQNHPTIYNHDDFAQRGQFMAPPYYPYPRFGYYPPPYPFY